MATASPLDPTFDRDPELDVAVEKLRAEQPLTDRERALVRARGLELAGCTDRLSVIDDTDNAVVDIDDPEEEQELLEAIVESEADLRDGRCVPMEQVLARLRATG
jgi:hypothetical protein